MYINRRLNNTEVLKTRLKCSITHPYLIIIILSRFIIISQKLAAIVDDLDIFMTIYPMCYVPFYTEYMYCFNLLSSLESVRQLLYLFYIKKGYHVPVILKHVFKLIFKLREINDNFTISIEICAKITSSLYYNLGSYLE